MIDNIEKWVKHILNAIILGVIGLIIWIFINGVVGEYKNQNEPFDTVYKVQSIRVDDDAEYHIIAVSSTGEVKTLHDLDEGYDLKIRYGNYNSVTLTCRGVMQNGFYRERGKPSLKIPFGFEIETFDD